MDQPTPQRKKARFSQHPQVFEYSSQQRKQTQRDSGSLLLDYKIDEPQARAVAPILSTPNYMIGSKMISEKIRRAEEENTSNKTMNNQQAINHTAGKAPINYTHYNDSQFQKQIEQINSDLAQIEAYLNQDSNQNQKAQTFQPFVMTPIKSPNFAQKQQKYFVTGRETMNIEQEARAKTTMKDIQNDEEISNNKRKAMSMKEKTVDQRISQVRNAQRITMNVKDLISMIKQVDGDSDKKQRQNRRNRITMDVFALSKMLGNIDEQPTDLEGNADLTPIKSVKSYAEFSKAKKVFSAFKENPEKNDIKAFVQNYVKGIQGQLQATQNENKKITDAIAQLKSQMLKIDLKISEAKKKIQKHQSQSIASEKKTKLINQQLNKAKYHQDMQIIASIEEELGLKVLKLDIEEQGCYGHFIFDGIFLKIRNKGKKAPCDIKLHISQQAKTIQNFLILIDNSLAIIKKYHTKLIQRNQTFFDTIIRVRKAYSTLQQLDTDLYYLSLAFEIKDFILEKTFDKLSFNVILGQDRKLLVELNLSAFLDNQFDGKAVLIYDPTVPGYLDMDFQSKDHKDSAVFGKIKKLLEQDKLF